jgi:hypothetical protein
MVSNNAPPPNLPVVPDLTVAIGRDHDAQVGYDGRAGGR